MGLLHGVLATPFLRVDARHASRLDRRARPHPACHRLTTYRLSPAIALICLQWLVPSADPTDYFNYGLTEDSWRKYSRLQTRVRQEMRQLQYAAMGVAPPAQSVRPHALSAAIKEPNLKNTSNNSSNTSGGGGGALPSPQAAASGGGGGGNANNVPLGTGTGGMAGFKRERE